MVRMRAVLTNFGSRGDVQPYLALALELQRHGHEPVMATSPEYGPWIEAHGLEFCPIGPEMLDAQRATMEAEISAAEIDHSIELMQPLLSRVKSTLAGAYGQLKDLCLGCDVLISGPEQTLAQLVHEVLGIPVALVQLGHFDLPDWPDVQKECASFMNPFRATLGLPESEDYLVHDPRIEIYAMSRHVISRPADWPDNRHLTGYFFLDEGGWRPDPSLSEFIESGEPPVVICFSSMIHKNPAAMTDLVVEAMGIAGYRAIIQQGWSGLGRRSLPASIYQAGSIPHSWLFRRAACVVHHGGAGTTASAFRAGVPSIFIPHYSDQPLWAMHFYRSGYSVSPIPLTQLSAERLAVAIAMTLSKPIFREKAVELGRKIDEEHGVEQARQLIEQIV